jgi:hypothetical protein
VSEVLKNFIEGIGALTEIWRITYSEFIKSGMKPTEALAHTQGFMTAYLTAGMNGNNKPNKD